MFLKEYKNKNIGTFISVPIKQIENIDFLDTLYLATYIKKLKGITTLEDVKKYKHYKETTKKWRKLTKNADDFDTLSKALKINIQVFNPLKKSDILTGCSSHFKKSYKTAQLLQVKKNTYKPMLYKGVSNFIGDINQLLNDDIVLIDQWNKYLDRKFPTNLTIVHRGTVKDPTKPEELMCDALLQKESIEYNGRVIKEYPQDGISYSGIGFDSDESFTGEYAYYLNTNNSKVCFNIKDTLDKFPRKDGVFKCPYTKIPLIEKKLILERFMKEKKYPDEAIYAAVDAYGKKMYGDSFNVHLEIDLEYDEEGWYKVPNIDTFFRNLQALKHNKVIGLQFEDFASLPKEIFQLTSLKQLYLGGNKLTSLPKEIGQLTSLEKLYLEYNELTSLPKEIGQLTSLKELELGKNKLTSLPKEIGQLTSLKKLSLSGNELTRLPKEIGQLTSLKELYLGVIKLTSLPKEIGQLTSLEKLYLGGNELTSLPKEIGQLNSLKELYLGGNKLTSLPKEIGQLTSFKELSLSGNELTSLPKEIGQLTSLKNLYLGENKLTSLPKEIGQLTSLKELELGKNKLTSLPKEIGQLTSLDYLNLYSNELTRLPKEIGQLTSLNVLSLYRNELTSLPKEIGQLTSLNVLFLGGNELTSLPKEIGQLTSLKELYLDENKLTSLPKEIGQLTSLDIGCKAAINRYPVE